MRPLTERSRERLQALVWLAWAMILMSWSGCSAPRVRVVPVDQQVTRVLAGEVVHAPVDGWFLGDALYQRLRRAVADRVLELELELKP
jgi:hypothetical protein